MSDKYLILAFNKEVVKRKEHKSFLNRIAYEIGLFNGGHYSQSTAGPEDFIECLFGEIAKSGIYHEPQTNDHTISFGAVRGKDYVSYGKIIKTVLL